MLAKLFQEFQPIGAAAKEAVAETRSSNAERTPTPYHRIGFDREGSTTETQRTQSFWPEGYETMGN
jgi:hypothetical protein